MTPPKSEFEREAMKAADDYDQTDDSAVRGFVEGARWGREYGRNEKQIEFENLEGSLCPEDFGFDEYIRHLRTKVDRLEAENSKLRAAIERARDEILGCTGHKDPTVLHELTAIINGQALGGE